MDIYIVHRSVDAMSPGTVTGIVAFVMSSHILAYLASLPAYLFLNC